MSNNQNTIEKIVNLAKARGFVYAGSEIYGGLANTWDYGPLGSILKDNIRDLWKKEFIQRDPNAYAVDAGILMHPRVWKASGHVDGFQDPLFDCKDCKKRFRADKVIEEYIYKREKQGKPLKEKIIVDAMSEKEMEEFIKVQGINCPQCGKNNFTEIRQFKLMFSTKRGVTEENTNEIYLRPETAQGQFVNFTNIVRSQRARVPFAAVQIGKAFRNEITPGNFLFRTIEFEQMEYQLFVKPGTDEEFYETMKKRAMNFYIKLGIDRKKLRFKDHDKLIFYAKAATDVHYEFPFGWDEITGVHNRTNYDLSRHQEFSTKSQEYTDPITNEKYIPYVIEYSVGLTRILMAFLTDAYNEEILENGETRVVLKLHPALAPYKVAVLPLQKDLSEKAKEVAEILKKDFMTTYDETGTVGKRYRRQDEIGTPFCVTIDFDTLKDETVTIRDRDTMKQKRIKISQLEKYIAKKIKF